MVFSTAEKRVLCTFYPCPYWMCITVFTILYSYLPSYILGKTSSAHKRRITTGNYTANTSLQEMYTA